ncbi:hypothetical protein B9Z55_013854 [Caenorhabditis nigoni]|uniref:Uncharacterized protein n=1 Tax=Caenorhabditis nigoni TaxID=1611254 RepID=A0A2G5U3I2_9PELO|nr:hypothetical protein B9Z55_013854 [Caenorhabditis nigoni]
MGLLFSKFSSYLFPNIECRTVMLGLDGAGKTTILYKLKLNETVNTIPTIGFHVETVTFQKLTLTVWDVGGGEKIRPLWKYYFPNATLWKREDVKPWRETEDGDKSFRPRKRKISTEICLRHKAKPEEEENFFHQNSSTCSSRSSQSSLQL